MGYWDGVLTGTLFGSILGVVATVGAEMAIACLAYAVYRVLVRLGLVKAETITEKPPVEDPA